jgi:uncharacterized peroxidase-related enzyme
VAHVAIPRGAPGILGLMAAYPETARHLNGLAEALLRGPSSLAPGEREVIAAYVSAANGCTFCTQAHTAAARHLLCADGHEAANGASALWTGRVSEKLPALLVIAGKVQQGGRNVTAEDVAGARAEGADDQAIHDTVLIAAAFCMFNRYVDGLATWAPPQATVYERMGAHLAEHGYLNGASKPRAP